MKCEKKFLFYGIILLFLSCWVICLTGCGADELENHAFPLALGVEQAENENLRIYMAYPNLQDTQASENALSSDVIWSGEGQNLFAGKEQMSANSNKNADFNHLKVLILNQNILEKKETGGRLLQFFQEEQDAAWNTYVMLTKEPLEQIFSEKLQISESLGIYLEDLLEEWEDVRQGAQVTVGTLMSQYYSDNETLCVPMLTIAQEKPQISGFCVLCGLEPKGELTLQEGKQMLLLQNALKQYEFELADGSHVSMEQIRTERKVQKVTDAEGNVYPELTVTVRGKLQVQAGSLPVQGENGESRQGEEELAGRLNHLLTVQQQIYGNDLTSSFLLLGREDRDLWKHYQGNQAQYQKDLKIRAEVLGKG